MLNSVTSVPRKVDDFHVSRYRSFALRFGLVALGAGSAYVAVVALGAPELFTDARALGERLEGFGWYGPFAIILMMTIAVVLSPLPSAPIALASGALYGHTWGTVYVLVGAQSGALIAFAIARYVRPATLAAWLEKRLSFEHYDSQHALMVAVCASRLMPFVSFDLASYAAGLTPLRLWRFALATLIGILPASFALAHFGGEVGSFDAGRIALALVLLGVLGVLPWSWSFVSRQLRMRGPR